MPQFAHLTGADVGGASLHESKSHASFAIDRVGGFLAPKPAISCPMESFAGAVEIVLKEGELRDQPGYRPGQAMWNMAATKCGYIQSRQAVAPGAGTVRVE